MEFSLVYSGETITIQIYEGKKKLEFLNNVKDKIPYLG
jgi:hypothetical protein